MKFDPEESLRNIMPPTSVKEMKLLGWDRPDVILFSGDAFIDHPSFGTAVIARVLLASGYRVAVVPQPNWRDDLRDFRKFGEPRLFFGVNAGVMDSMVNHYTAQKRLRSNDAYTPEGKAGQRPDYAVTVYTRILKKLYPRVPVVIGGVEASLRRFAHYDYWQDSLKPSILVDSGADLLIYGMGEKGILEVADAYAEGAGYGRLSRIPQTARVEKTAPKAGNLLWLPSYASLQSDRKLFAKHFNLIETNANSLEVPVMAEQYADDLFVVVNPPYRPLSQAEMDAIYDLPFTGKPHPRYRDKHIPAYEMIKFSITTHRGCFGGCSFCTIAAHQGKFIQSRSVDSIVREAERLASMPEFKGVISDLGAPTANMYRMGGKDRSLCAVCKRKSCLFPSPCRNLDKDHSPLLEMYRRVCSVKGIRKAFVGSGIRYDLFLDRTGFFDKAASDYFREVVVNHTSGRFKVAPEHTEDKVLKLMSKPSFTLFERLRNEFDRVNRHYGLRFQIVPYFISSHPGCTEADMRKLASNPVLRGINLDQVQDFTPTPMTKSTAEYYSGINPDNGEPVFCEHNQDKKKSQKRFFREVGKK